MASSSMNAGSLLGNPPVEKLTRTNHLLWKAQVMPALRGARMLGLVDGKEPEPPENITTEKDGKATSTPNPAYDTWLTRDQQVLSYLIGTLSPEILALAVGMEHAAEVWDLVNSMFMSRSKLNVTHLRGALSNTKKLNMSAGQYVAKMKGFATELIAAGRPIEEDELRDLILNGLDEEYDGVWASVNGMTNCTIDGGMAAVAVMMKIAGGMAAVAVMMKTDGGMAAVAVMMKIDGGMVVVAAVPHKEDMDADVDVVEDHPDSATTSHVKYARKMAISHPHAGGAMRTTTTTTMRESHAFSNGRVTRAHSVATNRAQRLRPRHAFVATNRASRKRPRLDDRPTPSSRARSGGSAAHGGSRSDRVWERGCVPVRCVDRISEPERYQHVPIAYGERNQTRKSRILCSNLSSTRGTHSAPKGNT
ncbi:hypothetical protein QYE76_002920 [Lolium multiflorum]|uniref:Retrotransposon Copia-like N-terminal domain-containing protein n=1 Tax=Lolium multiflorum TaxID=4521 RepID=A0AAD8VYD0_LOLMU|nr:hypothetical protein QYE76_002920 [Lolium multiflorum]